MLMDYLNEKLDEGFENPQQWFEETKAKARNGDSLSAEVVGCMLVKNGKYEDSLSWLEFGASKDGLFSTHQLGWLYYTGTGIQKNHEKAFGYFDKGAKLGIPESTGLLGIMYSGGFFVKKNSAKAKSLFLESAKGGSVEAMKWIGLRYHNGVDDLIKNPLLGQAWLKVAATGNDPRAIKETDSFDKCVSKLPSDLQVKIRTKIQKYSEEIKNLSEINSLTDDLGFDLKEYMPSLGFFRFAAYGFLLAAILM